MKKESSLVNPQIAQAAPVYPNSRQHQFAKRWKVAQQTSLGATVRNQNQLTEMYYNRILLKVKERYATLEVTAYEKDHREDNTENAFSMHTFLTPQFYWHLSCELNYEYKVSYDFYHFPFEAERSAR